MSVPNIAGHSGNVSWQKLGQIWYDDDDDDQEGGAY